MHNDVCTRSNLGQYVDRLFLLDITDNDRICVYFLSKKISLPFMQCNVETEATGCNHTQQKLYSQIFDVKIDAMVIS